MRGLLAAGVVGFALGVTVSRKSEASGEVLVGGVRESGGHLPTVRDSVDERINTVLPYGYSVIEIVEQLDWLRRRQPHTALSGAFVSKQQPERVSASDRDRDRFEQVVAPDRGSQVLLDGADTDVAGHRTPSVETPAGVPAPAVEVDDTVGAGSDTARVTSSAAGSDSGPPHV